MNDSNTKKRGDFTFSKKDQTSPSNIPSFNAFNIKEHKEMKKENVKEEKEEEERKNQELENYLAEEAYKKLDDPGISIHWLKICYRQNRKIAETVLATTLEIAKKQRIRSKGAMFTYLFKKQINKRT